MASAKQDRPIRVVHSELELMTCPVCRQQIVGTVTGEVHLGDIHIAHHPEGIDLPGDMVKVQVSAPTTTRIRGMKVAHECSAPALVPVTDDENPPQPARRRAVKDQPQA